MNNLLGRQILNSKIIHLEADFNVQLESGKAGVGIRERVVHFKSDYLYMTLI